MLGFLLLLPLASRVRAESVTVPAKLQAELLSRLVGYDRNFAARAGKTARVLVVVKRDDAQSDWAAQAMQLALSRLEALGGLPHEEKIMTFETGGALAHAVRRDRVAVVYLTPGLDADIGDVRAALSGVDVLTVAAVPEYVPRGIVLGFEVLSGKPKMSLNLPQAKQQHVDFSSDVLRLMRVYR